MNYELIAHTIADPVHGIRYRDYTTSLRRAQVFAMIPRIESAPGHGVVFRYVKMNKRGMRKSSVVHTLQEHVLREMERIEGELRAARKIRTGNWAGSETGYMGGQAPRRKNAD